MKVSSCMMQVSDLDRSIDFYCKVFSCRVALHEKNSALLLSSEDFQIYLREISMYHAEDLARVGVLYIMWSTDSEVEFAQVADGLRRYDPAAMVSTMDGLTLLDGRDPDGTRIVIAYPSPGKFPRATIAARFSG